MRASNVHAVAAGLLLLGAAGCGQRLPPQADSETASAALRTALDAWQQGESPAALAARTPPIYFTDLHWQKGMRLTRYQIDKAEPYGRSVRLTAQLFLQEVGGKTRPSRAVYTADTDPAVVIVPDGF